MDSLLLFHPLKWPVFSFLYWWRLACNSDVIRCGNGYPSRVWLWRKRWSIFFLSSTSFPVQLKYSIQKISPRYFSTFACESLVRRRRAVIISLAHLLNIRVFSESLDGLEEAHTPIYPKPSESVSKRWNNLWVCNMWRRCCWRIVQN